MSNLVNLNLIEKVNMTILQSAVIAYPYGGKMRERHCGSEEVLANAMKEDRRGRLKMYLELNDLAARRKRVLNLACLLILLISQRNTTVPRSVRTCHRLQRTTGWWHTEVVHAPQACIFRAHGARGTHIFRSPYHFFANQVVGA